MVLCLWPQGSGHLGGPKGAQRAFCIMTNLLPIPLVCKRKGGGGGGARHNGHLSSVCQPPGGHAQSSRPLGGKCVGDPAKGPALPPQTSQAPRMASSHAHSNATGYTNKGVRVAGGTKAAIISRQCSQGPGKLAGGWPAGRSGMTVHIC